MHEPVSAKGMRQFRIAFFASLLGSIVLDLVWITHEDYTGTYVFIWNEFLAGRMTFAYPIGFLLFFSWLIRIGYLAPKLVFLAFHVMTSYQVYRLLSNREEFGKREIISCAYFLFNPFLCATSIYGGLFDTVIGFLVLNFVLLLESEKENDFLKDIIKDAIALLLIGLLISIKFVGVVIVVPYLISGKKTMLRRLLLVAGGVALVLGGLILMHVPIENLIQPFLNQASRKMLTIFDGLKPYFPGLETPPFVAAFVDFYTRISVVVTVIAVVVADLFFFIKKMNFRTRVLLNIMVFLTFFHVFNAQFIIWYLPLFTLAYNDYMPSKRALAKKMAVHQGFMLVLSFLYPFSQFLHLYFIYDVYKNETGAASAARPLASQAGESAQVPGKSPLDSPIPVA